MCKWYTSIGRKTGHGDGKFYVRIGTEEKVLVGLEIYLWSSMLWCFTLEEFIYGRLQKLLRFTFPDDSTKSFDVEAYQYCFRRLCNRGLVVMAEGENEEKAKANLFRTAIVETQSVTLSERLYMFLTSLANGHGIRFSLGAFHKQGINNQERELLRCFQKCGEIAQYLEEMQDKENMQESFLCNVATLYKKKLLLIQKVGKEVYEK